MKSTLAQVVGAVAAIVVALLLHGFYVDYATDAKAYLLSWPASAKQRESLVDRIAQTKVTPEKIGQVQSNAGYSREMAHIAKYCEPTQRSRDALDFSRDPNDKDYFRCSKPFVPSKVSWKRYVTPGVTIAQAKEAAAAEVSARNITFGMVPAMGNDGMRPSATAHAKSFWLGVILPFSLFAFALLLLGTAFFRHRPAPANGERPVLRSEFPPMEEKTMDETTPIAKPSNTVVVDLIKQEFGADFPVSSGTGKQEDPFFITATSDYVSVEYALARHVFTTLGEEYNLSTQNIVRRDGRMIDELVFDAKKAGEADWKGIRRFYFDITAGFTAGRQPPA